MRRIDTFQILCALTLLLLGLLVGGCGLNSEQAAQETTRRFVNAMETGNRTEFLDTLTATANRKMMEYPSFVPEPSEAAKTKYTVGRPAIQREYASVPVTLEHDKAVTNATLRLRFEEGNWRVASLQLHENSNSPEVTMDFENPDADIVNTFRGLGQTMGAVMRGLGQGVGAFLRGMRDGMDTVRSEVRKTDEALAKMEASGRKIGETMGSAGKQLSDQAHAQTANAPTPKSDTKPIPTR